MIHGMAWFGVRSVIEFDGVFEERVVLFSAGDIDSAIRRAETEAHAYVEALGSGRVLDFCQAYEIGDDEVSDGAEVFSLMRTSGLAPEAYLSTYFDTGDEHQQR